jgi:urease accessory protein
MLTKAHLTLTQWLSPVFPTGAFAYSHGLEAAIADTHVQDAASLAVWLENILRFAAGWQDAVLLAHALDDDADLDALDATARALQPGAERLQESLEQGAAFTRTVAGMAEARGCARPMPPRLLPVALGQAAAPLALPKADVIALFLQGFASNLVTIAIRHVPLGQTHGQAVLVELVKPIHDLAQAAATAPLDMMGTCALAGDLAALRHETMDVRIFRT